MRDFFCVDLPKAGVSKPKSYEHLGGGLIWCGKGGGKKNMRGVVRKKLKGEGRIASASQDHIRSILDKKISFIKVHS